MSSTENKIEKEINKDDDCDAQSENSKLLRRRDTVYEDILGMMIRETEEGIKRTMKLQTVLEHDEHRRRLPYQLLKKDLNKVINEVLFTNGIVNIEKDIKFCQYFNKPMAVPSIGVDKNNLNCGESVHFDIDSESTKLPFFCKIMIVNQGRVHERSEPTLNRDVCLQIGESLIEKLFLQHRPNLHNVSLNASRFLDLDQHAIEDPNVSFLTPRSTRQRRPSWCCMEEYYSIPFYQYKGKEKAKFEKSANTNISMGFTVNEYDNLFTGLNENNNPNKNVTSQVVDQDNKEFSKVLLNDVSGTEKDVEKPAEPVEKPLLPTITTTVPRKRMRCIQLTFTDQYTNTTSIPVNTPSSTIPSLVLSPRIDAPSKSNPTITVLLPASSPRDISIRIDDKENTEEVEEIYFVKDGATDTDDLVTYYSKTVQDQPALSGISDETKVPVFKKYYTDPIIENKEKIRNSVNALYSNPFGRLLRLRYYKKTTGKDPMRFDEYIPYSLRTDSINFPSLFTTELIKSRPQGIKTDLEKVDSNDLQSTPNAKDRARRPRHIEEVNSARGVSFSGTSRSTSRKRNNNISSNKEEDKLSPGESIEFEIENELDKLLNEYDKSRKDTTRLSNRTHLSKNNSIADVLSISTIESGDNNIIDANSCFNNSLEFEPPVNDYLKVYNKRGVSAYPDYSRYPLISKALNRSLTNITPRAQSSDNYIVKSSSFIENQSGSQTPRLIENIKPINNIQPKQADVEQQQPKLKVQISTNEANVQKISHNNYVHSNQTEFCPQCFRESLRQEHKHLYEKENLSSYRSEHLSPQRDLTKRIANIIELENENTRYLLKTFISPVLRSRTLTSSRSLDNKAFKNNIINSKFYKKDHMPLKNDNLVSSMRSSQKQNKPEKYKHVQILPTDPKYYRIRHDKTLKLYKEPMPADIVKHNFEDLANVTAVAGKSLAESGILLKTMSKFLSNAEV